MLQARRKTGIAEKPCHHLPDIGPKKNASTKPALSH
jgi:hypothetical protein